MTGARTTPTGSLTDAPTYPGYTLDGYTDPGYTEDLWSECAKDEPKAFQVWRLESA